MKNIREIFIEKYAHSIRIEYGAGNKFKGELYTCVT